MMLLKPLAARRILPIVRSSQVLQLQNVGRPIQAFRRSTMSKSTVKAGKNTLYPERLIVYHAGTGRTVFLGCLKVTTIFIFSFFCLVVAPTHFFAEEEPKWVAAGVLFSGIIPMVTVAYITGPFVNYIHLRVPAFARNSREMLMRYSKSLPKDAEIDITTMNFIGKPRVTRVKVADLRPANQRFGLANYTRDTEEANAQRPWWMGKAVSQFGLHSGRTKIMGGKVWENIRRTIEKR